MKDVGGGWSVWYESKIHLEILKKMKEGCKSQWRCVSSDIFVYLEKMQWKVREESTLHVSATHTLHVYDRDRGEWIENETRTWQVVYILIYDY